MTLPTITTLPETPSRQDPTNFASEADAFLGALPTFGDELNSLGSYLDTLAGTIDAQADAAIEAAGAEAWVSGQAYSAGNVVYSLIDYRTYRANTSTSGTTDPSLSSSWTRIGGLSADSNGDVTFSNSIIETVYTLTGTALDPNNGTIQVKTLTSATTFTENFSTGESMVLQITNGSQGVVWPSVTWISSSGNVAPTLGTSDTVALFKIGTTLYGAWVGSAA